MVLRFRYIFIIVLLQICFSYTAFSQLAGGVLSKGRIDAYDSLYIETYPDFITGRLYLSEKSTNLTIKSNEDDISLNYLPNTLLNLGIGATVNSITLNLSYGFRFLNPDKDQGKTRYLDLQSHMYTRKLVIDFYGQFYKGMYLENTQELDPEYPEPYYIRPDIYEQIFGLTALYVFNNEKYSYRAALIQNERQLKSAGSFLAGLEGYYGLVQADSALVPTFIDQTVFEDLLGYERLSFLKVGPSAGYTYTLIFAKQFFAMASLTFNFGAEINHAYNPDKSSINDFQLGVGAIGRFAIGYNNTKWYLGVSGIYNRINTKSDSGLFNADYGIGNLRFNFAKRFPVRSKLKPYVDKVP